MSAETLDSPLNSAPVETVSAWRSWAELFLGVIFVPLILLIMFYLFWKHSSAFIPFDQSGQEMGMIEEWLNEARIGQVTLSDLTSRTRRSFLGNQQGQQFKDAREDLLQFLEALGVPASVTLNQQIPLFPNIFQMTVEFSGSPGGSVVWNSGLPKAVGANSKSWELRLRGDPGSKVRVEGQLRTYEVRKEQEEESRIRAQRALSLMACLLAVSLGWLTWSMRQRAKVRKEKRKLREAHLEAESRLHHTREEKLAAETALLQNRLEQQEQLLKSMQVVAGAYAHNLQNLLLPPGRLVEDCIRHQSLERGDGEDGSQEFRLRELKRLLAQVSDRVRQTMQALKRDPGQYKEELLDLGRVVAGVLSTWKDLADQKWQIDVLSGVNPKSHQAKSGDFRVRADESHLAQAIENLVVNARDAIFEKRSQLLREAQSKPVEHRKNALLEAAAWRGRIEIGWWEAGSIGEGPGLYVEDNGRGMTPETLSRCLAPGFTTKQGSALAHGVNSGMGLGLAFLASTLERMGAQLGIRSELGKGTKVTINFPRFQEKEGPGASE